ncbi:hypothetical protein EDD15DRAFT_757063 [Pisolithus albus]|nr:hypothetical protein EDD15DRAFT_757063 [Pisolithus albus]
MTSRLWTPSSHRAAHYYDARLTIGTSVNTSAPPEWAHLLSIVVMTSVDSIIHGSPCEVADGNNTQDPVWAVARRSFTDSAPYKHPDFYREPSHLFMDDLGGSVGIYCTQTERGKRACRPALVLVSLATDTAMRTIMGQTYLLREELGELPSEPSAKCLRCDHRHIRGSHSSMVVCSKILYAP